MFSEHSIRLSFWKQAGDIYTVFAEWGILNIHA